MGKLQANIIKFGERTSSFFCNFSLRKFVALVGVIIAVSPVSLAQFTFFDKALAYVVTVIEGYRPGSAKFTVVVVDDSELHRWQNDFYVASKLSSLVSNILHSSRAQVGLFFDEELDLDVSSLDSYLENTETTAPDALRIVQQKKYLAELLLDPRVTLGVFDWPYALDQAIAIDTSRALLPTVKALAEYFGSCRYCKIENMPQKSGVWYWIPPAESIEAPIFYGNGSAKYPSFYAAFYFSALGRDDAPLTWNGGDGISGNGRSLNVSPEGELLAAHGLFDNLSARKIVISFSEAVSVNAFPDYVLVGSEKNKQHMLAAADIIYSLENGHAFHSPWWEEFVIRFLVLCITAYCVFVQIKLRSFSSTIILPLAVIVLGVFAVVYFSLSHKIWLHFFGLFLWVLVATGFVGFWQINRNKIQLERGALDRAMSEASFALEKSEHYAEAISLLAHHSNRVTAIEKICQMGDSLARDKGDFDQAITLLGSVAGQDASAHKLQRHVQMLREEKERSLQPGMQSSSEPKNTSPIPRQLGRYIVERELGRGAVGVVYLGFDPAISRKVAIKTLDTSQFSSEQSENLKSRFFREAEAAGRLSHPNIVSIYDVGEQGDLAYIAMDYVNGTALSDHTTEESLLPVGDVYHIIYDVALALDYAHKHQIVHRDIKPGNIMYSDSPYQVKVTDFGIARLLDNSKTSTGEILGSPLYMAPEQLKGSKVDATADVFSLGVTFFQLLTGSLPFKAENLASLTYEIIHTRHKNVRSVRKNLPASAARIVNQCLQKDPRDRYESAIELASIMKKAIRRDFPEEAKAYGLV